MRISRRTSGGRGEYEISHAEDGEPSPQELVGRTIFLDLGFPAPLNTGVVLRVQGGKRRLRMDEATIQIPKQVAAVLMMPEPVRADNTLGSGAPVLQQGRYALDHILADQVLFPSPNISLMHITTATVLNRTYGAEEIDIRRRATQVQQLWRHCAEFPSEIADLIQQHKNMVIGGNTISMSAEDVVVRLRLAVSENSADLGIIYSEAADVLPALEAALKIEIPQPVLEIADIEVDDLAMKRRVLKEWRRWVSSRGPASARFRQNVRNAYSATCVICGVHYPPTPATPSPGVDAAHILPWSEYDMDNVSNGLCLCKTHHWAFDESLIQIYFEGSGYHVVVPSATRDAVVSYDPDFSLEALEQHAGIIPVTRLPNDKRNWPRPEYLHQLLEYAP